METRIIIVSFVILIITTPCVPQEQGWNNDTCRVAWSEAWSWGNALTVKDHFERLYTPHVSALLAADEKLAAGVALKDIVGALRPLPGLKGVVLCSRNGEVVQSPEGLVEEKPFSEVIFNRSEATFQPLTPMMQRMMGGQVRSIRAQLPGEPLDLMVRYFRPGEGQATQTATCLVLDLDWLLARIPSQMDSLAHESAQLLFWAASPTNRFEEQSLGITHGSDTLWWSGGKDVNVKNRQVIWPFDNIEVHSWVHPIEAR